MYQEVLARDKTVSAEEEQRLEVKKKPPKEPKIDEPPTPETPREPKANAPVQGDSNMDAQDVEADNLPDIDDSDMGGDTTEFYKEVDEAMEENDNGDDDHDTEMVAMMDILQTLGVATTTSADARALRQPTNRRSYGAVRKRLIAAWLANFRLEF